MTAGDKRISIASWLTRLAFFVVWVINLQCAFVFIFDPTPYAAGFQVEGVPGLAAVQGLGIAFLMWNATYPLFILRPERYRALGIIILAQQLIGLIGESLLLANLASGFPYLASAIARFVLFDGIGLLVMAATFIALQITMARN